MKRGFTLIEVILGITIVGVTMIALVQVFVLAQNITTLNLRRDYALANAQDFIEQVRADPYNSLVNGTTTGSAFTYLTPITITVNLARAIEDTTLAGLKQIRVTATFDHNGRSYTEHLVTYATRNGLND